MSVQPKIVQEAPLRAGPDGPERPLKVPGRTGGLSGYIDRHSTAVMLFPAVAFMILMMLAPVAYSVFLSFHDWTGGRTPPDFVGLSNYRRLAVQDARFYAALARTAIFTVAAVTLQTVLGMITALVIKREFFGKRVFRTIFILPMIMTPVAVALLWRLMFNPQLGIFNYLLDSVGLGKVEWLTSPGMALFSLILVDVWQFTPLITLIVLAGLLALPEDVYEAAAIDGASGWQSFWSITLPLLRPVLVIAMVFRGIDALKTFDSIAVITGGGPGTATETLNYYIYTTTFEYQRMGYASAMLVVYLIAVLTLLFLILKFRRVRDDR